jgi:hypothetical protein
MPHRAWTKREDIISDLGRLWNRGTILTSMLTGRALFPYSTSVRGPASKEISELFGDVQKWTSALISGGARKNE